MVVLTQSTSLRPQGVTKENRTMHTISRLGFASLAFGFAVLIAAPAARADGSEGMGLQAVAEMMRQDTIRSGHSGWRNGEARLVVSGTSYGVAYSGTPQGSVGRGLLTIVGNMDGNPLMEYADAAPSTSTLLAQRR
jgi:hypothetical protein